ncbi:MAG: hypothetical protein QGD94_11185, partial [Planctomycetia bacterium]|nr:hypothetical protein [Planctomycetia bacterium]
HRVVLGMEEFNGKIYTATQASHTFDGTEWKGGGKDGVGRGVFMNVVQGKLYYGMPNQARSLDAEGKVQTAAKQPIDSWGIDRVHPFHGLIYFGTGYACKLYNTRNINQPVAVWQHNTDDNIGAMAVYGDRLFVGTEGRKGEVWAMRTIDAGSKEGGGGQLSFDGCKWVWFPDKNLPSAPPGTYYFRRVVEIPAGRKLRDATFMLAADDNLELFHIGQPVAKSPEGGWAKVVIADVTDKLKAGKNVFGIAATNASGAGGLIGRLVLEYASGDVVTVNIDAKWKSAKTAPKGWLAAKFRDRGWSATQEFAGHGARPWGKLSVFRIVETAYESKHVRLVDAFDGLSDTWVSDVHAFRIYDGVLYAATGSPYFNKGIVSRFDGKKFAPIVKAKAKHAYCMDGEKGTLYVGTWPDGKVFKWQRKFVKAGSYVSPRINAKGKSVKAAKISWQDERSGGSLKYFASNDGGKTWKAAKCSGRRVSFSSPGDDLRLKVEIRRGSATATPVLRWWQAEF